MLVMLVRDIHVYVVAHGMNSLPTHVPTFRMMPWKIIPFAIGSFIMVEDLSASGWLSIFAIGLSKISSDLFKATLGMGFLSSLTSNLVNNQPMTILFTRILSDSSFVTTEVVRKGMMFALIMGSNFGANFTFIGALAGLMWTKICADKGVKITLKEFAKYGIIIMPVLITLACLTLTLEIRLWA